jgi:hypothetical protein
LSRATARCRSSLLTNCFAFRESRRCFRAEFLLAGRADGARLGTRESSTAGFDIAHDRRPHLAPGLATGSGEAAAGERLLDELALRSCDSVELLPDLRDPRERGVVDVAGGLADRGGRRARAGGTGAGRLLELAALVGADCGGGRLELLELLRLGFAQLCELLEHGEIGLRADAGERVRRGGAYRKLRQRRQAHAQLRRVVAERRGDRVLFLREGLQDDKRARHVVDDVRTAHEDPRAGGVEHRDRRQDAVRLLRKVDADRLLDAVDGDADRRRLRMPCLRRFEHVRQHLLPFGGAADAAEQSTMAGLAGSVRTEHYVQPRLQAQGLVLGEAVDVVEVANAAQLDPAVLVLVDRQILELERHRRRRARSSGEHRPHLSTIRVGQRTDGEAAQQVALPGGERLRPVVNPLL